jgi:hypothetical protein
MIILKERTSFKSRIPLSERIAKLREARVPPSFLKGLPAVSALMKKFLNYVAINGLWDDTPPPRSWKGIHVIEHNHGEYLDVVNDSGESGLIEFEPRSRAELQQIERECKKLGIPVSS